MFGDFELLQFEDLTEAFIDASSLIYTAKANFLPPLQEALILYTLPEILREAGMPEKDFQLVACHEPGLSNDEKLLHCANARRCPIISEDKKVLKRAGQAGLVYYNALMMLNFLLFKKMLTSEQYLQYYTALQTIARYHKNVWAYGKEVYQLILGDS